MRTAFKPIIYPPIKQLPDVAAPDSATHLDYRALLIGLDGQFIRAHGFFAEDDHAAMKQARQFAVSHPVDLWSGGRLVGKLKPMKTLS
jgi:hypothetical protein